MSGLQAGSGGTGLLSGSQGSGVDFVSQAVDIVAGKAALGATSMWNMSEALAASAVEDDLIGSRDLTMSAGSVTQETDVEKIEGLTTATVWDGTTQRLVDGVFNVDQDWTFGVWVKNTATTGNRMLMAVQEATAKYMFLIYRADRGGLCWQLSDGTTVFSPAAGGMGIGTGAWRYLTVWRKYNAAAGTDTWGHQVDNGPTVTATKSSMGGGGTAIANANIAIGSRDNVSPLPWVGSIGRSTLFDGKVLSASERSQNYELERVGALALPAAIMALSPLGYWKLDETSGTVAADSSGNNRDGAYVGAHTLADQQAADGGKYVSLAGGHITIPDSDAFSANTSAGLTVFAIIRPTELTGNGRHHIIAKGQGSAYEWEMSHSNVAAGLLYASTFAPGGAALSSVSFNSITTGWNVLGFRTPSPVRNADVDIYHNSPDEVIVSLLTTFAGSYANGAAPLVLGARNDFPAGQSFLGQIAHVAVFAGEVDVTSLYAAAEADGWYLSPTLLNAPAPLTIPTYEGSNQPTHPSIVDFGTAWNGYRYWMAMTPYPGQDDDFENPSIVASNDGNAWVVPAGLTNPIDAKPTPLAAYNADTELVYDSVNNRLVCFYLGFDGTNTKFVNARTSTNGTAWSTEIVLFTTTVSTNNPISLSVRKDGSTWRMWYVQQAANPNTFQERTSTDILAGWSAPTTRTWNGTPAGKDLWHSCVFRDGSVWRSIMCLVDSNNNGHDNNPLHLASSLDGITWTMDTTPIMSPSPGVGGWDSRRLYRATAVVDGTDADVWYSAFNNDSPQKSRIGRTRIPLSAWP